MSIEVMTWVWKNLENVTGTDLLFILALADKANSEEGACWPSVESLRKMCRLGTDRALQKVSARMQAEGHIGVMLYKGTKTKSGNTNKYFINGYRQSIGLQAIYSGKHEKSNDKGLREKMVHNPDGVNGRTHDIEVSVKTPDGVNNGTPDGVNGRTHKPLVKPSLKPSTIARERNRLFDGVSLICFGITATDEKQAPALEANKGRIAKLSNFLKKMNATPESLWAFKKWYEAKYPSTSMPNDLAKFSKHYNDFAAAPSLSAQSAAVIFQDSHSVTEDERDNALAHIQAMKKELKHD